MEKRSGAEGSSTVHSVFLLCSPAVFSFVFPLDVFLFAVICIIFLPFPSDLKSHHKDLFICIYLT